MIKLKPLSMWISGVVGVLTILTTIILLALQIGELRSNNNRLLQENIEIRRTLNAQREVMAGLHSLDQRVLERLTWLSKLVQEKNGG